VPGRHAEERATAEGEAALQAAAAGARGGFALEGFLAKLVPAVLAEQAFLGQAFWELDAFAAARNDVRQQALLAARVGATWVEAVAARDAALEQVFLRRADAEQLLLGLLGLTPSAMSGAGGSTGGSSGSSRAPPPLARIVQAAVVLEALAHRVGEVSPLLGRLLAGDKAKLPAALTHEVDLFAERQIAWVELDTARQQQAMLRGRDVIGPNAPPQPLQPPQPPQPQPQQRQQQQHIDEQQSLLPAVARLAGLVDRLAALWDAAARPRNCYLATDERFAKNSIGRALRRIAEAVVHSVERVAAKLPPGGAHSATALRLENYWLLAQTLGPRSEGPEASCSALRSIVQHVRQAAEAAMEREVNVLLAHALPQVVHFVRDVEQLLRHCDVKEVPFHKTRHDLAITMQAVTEAAVHSHLTDLGNRVRRRGAVSGGSASSLTVKSVVAVILERLRARVIQQYARYVQLIQECFGDLVTPSLEDVTVLADLLAV
jgi:hypothetical protein